MSSETLLEKRLEAVEHAVAELQRRLNGEADAPAWLEKLIGSITDEAAFREVLELGRAIRSSDRPMDEDDETS